MTFIRFVFVLLLSLALPFMAEADGIASVSATSGDTAMSHAPVDVSTDLTVSQLRNGLTVAVKRDARFPLASLRLYVHAGSAYETPDQAGISHQLEHMVFKGTEHRPKGAIATDVERVGGYLNAATSFDYTVYLTDMPSEHWALGMDVLKDMAFHPTLDPAELESEKEVVLAELQRGEDSPSSRLFKRVFAETMKGTPYERPIIGYPETIRAYTVDAIRDYIKRLYQPQSMLLLVVGDVDPAEVKARAEKLFGDIPNTRGVTPPKTIALENFSTTGPVITVEETPWNKVHMSVSFPGLSRRDSRAPAMDVFAQMLGGDTSSYLHRTYKYEKRLVDQISVGNFTFERTGAFIIFATLSADKLAEFWEALAADLPTLAARKFSDEELDRARLALTDAHYRRKETVAGTASLLGSFLFFEGGEDGERNYLENITTADRETISAAASGVMRPERMAVTVLKPRQATGAEQKSGTEQKPGAAATPDAAWIGKVLAAAWPVDAKAAAVTAKAAPGPAREVIDLGRGRTLVLMPDATMPYAAVDMAFAGGDALLTPDKQGLASLGASVLTRGTKSMDATALEAFKNDRAAFLSASSGREVFKISMDYPARFEKDMWNLLHETLTAATLPDAELTRARENQTAAIVSKEDQPLGLAFRKLFPFLFGEHVYGFRNLGEKAALPAFTRADVAAFWKDQSSRPWVLAVCGVFDRDAVIAAAKALPAPSATAPKIAQPAWTKEKTLTIAMPDRNQAHLMLVFPSAPLGSPDEPGMDLLRNILAGQSGLLFRDLRDKQGLGYTVTALQWQAPLAGSMIFYIGTETGKLEQARAGFDAVIKDLRENLLPETELVRGKSQMRGDYVRSRQKMSARSAEAAGLAILGRSLDAEREVMDKAMTLTPNDLRALARKYIMPDKAYVVTVMPE